MKMFRFIAFLLISQLMISYNLDGQNWGMSGIKGKGPKKEKVLDLSDFESLSLQISGTVYLSQGPQSVRVEAQENIIDKIDTEVKNETWKIKFTQNVRSHDGVKVWVSIPDLSRLSVSGSGDIRGESTFRGLRDLELAVSGSGDIYLDLESRSVNASISGSGGMDLAGKTGDCQIRISGSGDIEASDLEVSNCDVRISGSGDAFVHVNANLEVGIAGSGDVYYSGNPAVRSKISGSGDVKAKK